jgi:hypothetical protein
VKKIAALNWLLPLISGMIVFSCLFYCRFWWIPHPMTFADPDESFVCWMFCKTMSNYWFSLGLLFSAASMLGGVLMRLNIKSAWLITLLSGMLLLPAGLMNLISLYISKKVVR